MRKTILKLCFASLSIIFISSCFRSGGPCEEVSNITNSSIVVAFKNTSGRYLYERDNPLYNKDSLKVFDVSGNQLLVLLNTRQVPNTNKIYYNISIGSIFNESTDNASFSEEHCKDLIIQYNDAETDTLQICFRSRELKCGSVFETLKIYHMGNLLSSVTNRAFAEITLIKP